MMQASVLRGLPICDLGVSRHAVWEYAMRVSSWAVLAGDVYVLLLGATNA